MYITKMPIECIFVLDDGCAKVEAWPIKFDGLAQDCSNSIANALELL